VRGHILRDLNKRICRYRETGDAELLTGLEVSLQVRALLGPNGAFDAEVAQTIATLHWLRYRAEGFAHSGTDLAMAMRLFALLHERDPEESAGTLPRPVRMILECARGR